MKRMILLLVLMLAALPAHAEDNYEPPKLRASIKRPPLNQIKGLTAIRGKKPFKWYYYEDMSGGKFITYHRIKGAPDLRDFKEVHPKVTSSANWGGAIANIFKLPVEIAVTTFVGFWQGRR